jgi:pyruvate, water dikinase
MKMVRADIGTSGIMFTLDIENSFRGVVLISAAYGLGGNVVQGALEPDEFMVFKPTFERGDRPMLCRSRGAKNARRALPMDIE